MMNRMIKISLILFSIFIIAGCGETSKEDVVEDLEQAVTELTSYQTKATMTMQTGETAQHYQIDVAYQADQYYRVYMHNEEDEEGSQIILKNDQGVFVLTPALNKSFQFQSDWPTDHSLSWAENGIDYYLASESLTEAEMIEVAQSMTLQLEK